MIGKPTVPVQCDGRLGGQRCRAGETVTLSTLLSPEAAMVAIWQALPRWRITFGLSAYCPDCAPAVRAIVAEMFAAEAPAKAKPREDETPPTGEVGGA